MKTCFLTALLSAGLICSTTLNAQWSVLSNIIPANGVNVVWAPDANTVFAVYDNKVIRSTNGGLSWDEKQLGTSSNPFFAEDIHFFDAQHGMIVGDMFFGFIAMCYTTHDGGQTWLETELISGGTQVEAVRMVSPMVAYAAAWNGALFKTTDGGVTWNYFTIPGETEHWNDLEFPDPMTGFLVSNDYRILSTHDGGVSWQVASLPSETYPQALQFFDAQNGIMFSANGLFKTTDSGQSWTKYADISFGVSGPIYFSDFNNGWVASNNGFYKTIDGGQTWLKQFAFSPPQNFSGIHFSGTTGWAVGTRQNGTGLVCKAVNNGGMGVALSTPPAPICYFEAAVFSCLHDGATSFAWYVNDVLQGSNSSTFAFTPWFDGSYEVYCIAANANQSLRTDTYQFFVYTDPILPFNGTAFQDSICRGTAIDIELAQLYADRQYRVQVGNTILTEITAGAQPSMIWNSGPLDTTTTFDFYALFLNCPGWKKMNSVVVHVVDQPDGGISLTPDAAVICEKVPLEIQLNHSELHVMYQVFSNGIAVSQAQSGTGAPITLAATGLQENTTLTVLASASTFCQTTFAQTLPVLVQKVDPMFAASTQTLGIGELIAVENTSADSLQFLWRFINGAASSSSTQQHPAPVYLNEAGLATVELVGITPSGCRDSVQSQVRVADFSHLNGDWALPILSNGQKSLEMDSLGNLYGYSFGKTELLDRASPNVITIQGVSGTFYKYDRRGILQWANTFDDKNGIPLGARVYDQKTDKSGNSYFLVSLIGVSDEINFSSTDGRNVRVFKRNCWAMVKYSPNGILKWVRFVEMRNAQGQEINNLAYWPVSMAVDAEENLFISSYFGNTQYPAKLVLSSPEAYLDTIDIVGGEYYQYLVKVAENKSFGWVTRYVDDYSWFSGSFYGFYTGAIVKPDAKGGCYLWLNGGVSDSRAMQLVHFAQDGQLDWTFEWGGGEANSVSNYAWANDMQVDESGNIYLLGSASAISDYIFSNIASGQPGVFLIKMSAQGQVRWSRAFRQQYPVQSSANPYALGLALAGDRLHVLCEIQQQNPWVFTNWQCFDSLFAENHRLFWTSWDTLGNLLQVKATDIFEPNQHSPSAVSGRVKAFDGKIYFLGNSYQTSGGNFWGVQLPTNLLNPNSRRFLAAITDPEDYVPYINTCDLTQCVLDSVVQLQISYLFSDIQWRRNNTDLPGYQTPAIIPPTSAAYTVQATNPIGIQQVSPTPAQVHILPVPNTTLIQQGPYLVAAQYQSSVYRWLDSTGQVVHVSLDSFYLPPQSGWYSVSIDGLESCDATGSPYYFDITHSATDNPGAAMLLRISPNPNAGDFALTFPETVESGALLRIFDARGTLMHTQTLESHTPSVSLHLPTLPAGIYWVKVMAQQGRLYNGKFIKN